MQDTDKDTESKRQIEYDMIYLAAYGINSKPVGKQSIDGRGRDRKSTDRKDTVTTDKPDERCLERYRTSEDAMKNSIP